MNSVNSIHNFLPTMHNYENYDDDDEDVEAVMTQEQITEIANQISQKTSPPAHSLSAEINTEMSPPPTENRMDVQPEDPTA